MRWKFQYSLSSLLWFTLCLALVLSSYLMYRRMAKAEKENIILRGWAGYAVEGEPVLLQFNWPIDIDIVRNVTSIMKGGNCVISEHDSQITLRNNFSKEIKIHFPLLRKSNCSSDSCQFIFTADLEPEFKQSKTIALKPGESFTITFAKSGTGFPDPNFFEGKESFDYGRWALVFGVPEGENPDDYLVGTVLTNPIHWKIDKNCKYH